MYHHHQTRRPGYRETAQTPLPHPRRPVPVQCHELSPRRISDAFVTNVYDLHRSLLIQIDHPHEHRELHTFLRGISRQETRYR